jgi:hypothetical protein
MATNELLMANFVNEGLLRAPFAPVDEFREW